jgi:hypothetical protein
MSWDCPVCATRLDAHVPSDGVAVPPQPGDLTLCLHCATVLVRTPEAFAPATEADWVGVSRRERARLEQMAAHFRRAVRH